ncbi:ABC transporter substrate-binding protein [Streptomyces sp. NPDC051018]|uniref:ABC transporter substrate-binding protein n=1 Tax=Streptomyces sp. NPDC051018 TaxID=3365639 RepID=UPI0037B6A324
MRNIEGTQGLGRRRFLGQSLGAAGLVGLGGLATACAGDPSPRATSRSLRIVTPDGVGQDYYLGNSYPWNLLTMVHLAWPLFLGSRTDFGMDNALAESYEASPDGLTHTVTIRPALTFHDGSPLDARAVAEVLGSYFFAGHRLRDKGTYGMVAAAFGTPATVAKVEATGDRTVRIRLTKPKSDIRDPLNAMRIMNPKILARSGYGTDEKALRDIGSGPFRLTRFAPGSFVEFERFTDFFEKGNIDRLRYELVADPAARALALRSGEADLSFELTRDDHEKLAADPGFSGHVSAPANNVFFRFTTPKKPQLEDRRVREAIWLATDRAAYRKAFFNSSTVAPSTQAVVVPGIRGHAPGLQDRPHDLTRARKLLDQAGVRNLKLSTMTVETSGPIMALRSLHEAVAADLKKVGIDVDIKVADQATYFAERFNHDYEILFYGNTFDPGLLFRLFYIGTPKPWERPSPLADPAVRKLVDTAASSVDPKEQERLWQQLQRLNHEELLMGFPIANVGTSVIAAKHVRDLRLTWLNRTSLCPGPTGKCG